MSSQRRLVFSACRGHRSGGRARPVAAVLGITQARPGREREWAPPPGRVRLFVFDNCEQCLTP